MRKSVYSLVLMDDVVAEIDRLAYETKTNRSALINRILAESLHLTTPEMRMRDIFERLETVLSESCYQVLDRSSDSMFSVRSAIRYKYRPTVKYSIELFREPMDIAGRLKVSFRTSSKAFVEAVEDFFTRWMRMEDDYLKKVHRGGGPASFDSAKYIRGFLEVNRTSHLSEKDIALAIGEYIKLMDHCIKFYFEHIEDILLIEERIQHAYRSYLSSGVYLI